MMTRGFSGVSASGRSDPSGRLDFYSKCFWSLLVFDLNFASARGLTTIMVPTLVSSNPHIFFDEAHGVQPTTLLDLDEQPAVLVDKALQTMKREGIQVIEWRALLSRRMKVPVFVKNFHYVVPDNQLESASACLSNLGLPLMPLSDFRINVDGDFHLKGKFHRITVGTESWDLQQIALYPLSFSTLSMSELTEEPPMRLYPSQRCPKILIPRPAWPESHGYGPAFSGSGLTLFKPELFARLQAGSGLAQAQATAQPCCVLKNVCRHVRTGGVAIRIIPNTYILLNWVYRAWFDNQDSRLMFVCKYCFFLQYAVENESTMHNGKVFGKIWTTASYHLFRPFYSIFNYLIIPTATAQGSMHCEPEPWAFLGLDDGPKRPGFGTAGSGWLTALGRAWHITTSDPMWINLLSEISQLIGYHLYELSQGFVDINDDKVWEELEMDKRLEKAYLIVIGWGCDGEWRNGEE
ncbi:uncharacterized protein LACBIDRAFT_325175 [Laccaria bicolor S238N-H82]|uniref:Predicted protein n=1 Tax=Laccaria bicolor (strain S238N-H82 / ATCC MYA-4686) TaxID=486041 RepID=B0D431_LACBS|nr:uncharacterized protein LACBIDRAFT_325175 [Laccaria bicolor S238N-H82]EDR10505.1 predicted protein [Laccaria bicolor S238N-H82]|eukprot:XP_001878955.1 predicted protein [Laccaria bicolor S238N-H82]